MKNKNRNSPLSDIDKQIIDKIDRKLLFPVPKGIINKLQTSAKKTNHTPKPMNSFMVFRCCLNLVVKESLHYDGKNLSCVAAHLWNGADKKEKQGYNDITKLLKTQHGITYPHHVERRRRKQRFNFVYCNENYKSTNPQVNTGYDSNIIMESQEQGNGASCRENYKQINRQVSVNITTERQEQENEINSFFTYYIPTTHEYGTAEGLFIQQQQQQQQQQHNSFYYSEPETCENFYVGDSNPGFNVNHINYGDLLLMGERQ